MKRYILPLTLFVFGAVSLYLHKMALNDVYPRFFLSVEDLTNWKINYPHYYKIRFLIPSRLDHTKLVEEAFSDEYFTPALKNDDGHFYRPQQIKKIIDATWTTSELLRYLDKRIYQSIGALIIATMWTICLACTSKLHERNNSRES